LKIWNVFLKFQSVVDNWKKNNCGYHLGFYEKLKKIF
jgi:hypothetical protein